MDTVYDCPKDEDSLTADIQCFYLKSKVPICLAITESFYFLKTLNEASLLSEEESLELQGDTRTVHRVVYESLCWLEDKDISLPHFFEFLFKKSFLRKYPDLKPIHAEYKEGKYQHGIHSTPDKEKDSEVFAKDKVKICLAITDRFPFLHGLQDLAILSETESLKLQADERPVSRVIYESLSLIEKKDLKLNVVFEYIFQSCYLKLYPGLEDILREPNGEFVAPFNGEQYPKFNIATDLPEFFEHNKTYICTAVNERFPFLHGLHDYGLLSYIQLLRLQADKRSTIDVLEEALSHIQTINDIKSFFAYVLQEFYLKLYPNLHITLNSLNAALTLDVCLPSSVSCGEKNIPTQDNTPYTVIVKNEMMEAIGQNSSEPSTVSHEDETRNGQEQESNEPSRVFSKDEITDSQEQDSKEPSRVLYKDQGRVKEVLKQEFNGPLIGSGGALTSPVRRCRLQPISYSEPPDLICEINNTEKKHRENSRHHKFHKRKAGETSLNAKERSELGQVTKRLTVMVEFPKQVFNETFRVRCGDKKGIFKKALWTGNTRRDYCIISDNIEFSVSAFEKYGGRGASKNWKKSIQCQEIKLDCLIKAGILRRPKGHKMVKRVTDKLNLRMNQHQSKTKKLRIANHTKVKVEAKKATDQNKIEETCASTLARQIQNTGTLSEKIMSVHSLLSVPREDINSA